MKRSRESGRERREAERGNVERYVRERKKVQIERGGEDR